MLLPLAEARGVALETSGDVAPTAGSPALLLQVVTNLVHNGIVHNTRKGPGIVRVDTAVQGDHVELVVENTGNDVPADLIPTLTQPFQRGGGRVHDDHDGTGLGLAIVEAVVRSYGGRLDVRVRAGGGLIVRVCLAAGSSE